MGWDLDFLSPKPSWSASGARLEFSNREAPDHGAVVEIIWPRDEIEADTGKTMPRLA